MFTGQMFWEKNQKNIFMRFWEWLSFWFIMICLLLLSIIMPEKDGRMEISHYENEKLETHEDVMFEMLSIGILAFFAIISIIITIVVWYNLERLSLLSTWVSSHVGLIVFCVIVGIITITGIQILVEYVRGKTITKKPDNQKDFPEEPYSSTGM